jgi:hypothetical protein
MLRWSRPPRVPEPLTELPEHLLHVLELERLLPVLKGAGALEVETEAAAWREVEEGAGLTALLATRAREHGAATLHLFLVIERPRRDEALARELANALLIERVEVAHPDGELAAQIVEEHAADFLAVAVAGAGQHGMASKPLVLVSAEVGQGQIVDLEQAALLEVGRGDAPATAKILIEIIAKHLAPRAIGFFAGRVLDAGIHGIEGKRQIERTEYLQRELVVAQAALAGRIHGAPQGRA